jgi:hypothetical protein
MQCMVQLSIVLLPIIQKTSFKNNLPVFVVGKVIFFFPLVGAHVDNVYMGRGTSDLLTIWTPFGPNPIEMGTLAVVESSHKLPELQHFQVTKIFLRDLGL